MFSHAILFAATDLRVAPYLAGTVLGFLIGGFGHLIKAPALIILGIVMIGVTSAVFLILSNPAAG